MRRFWFAALFVVLTGGYASYVYSYLTQPTDVLFAMTIHSEDAPYLVPVDVLYAYLESRSAQSLVDNSVRKGASLIEILIVQASFKPDEEERYRTSRLLDVLERKGVSFASVSNDECNYADKIIMSGNVFLYDELVGRGYSHPLDGYCSVDVLHEYKFRYSQGEYEKMLEFLSASDR